MVEVEVRQDDEVDVKTKPGHHAANSRRPIGRNLVGEGPAIVYKRKKSISGTECGYMKAAETYRKLETKRIDITGHPRGRCRGEPSGPFLRST